MSDILIRPATKEDIPQSLDFLITLALYEKLPNEVKATEKTL